MKRLLLKIYKLSNFRMLIYLLFVCIIGIYLYTDRPIIKDKNDVIELTGTLDRIDKIINPFSRQLFPTRQDSLLYIFLKEYPCKFQVSYCPFDEYKFYSCSKEGDKIILNIARVDKYKLSLKDKNVRSFSLEVNDIQYIKPLVGISGFGPGYFELAMIIIPLILITIMVIRALRQKDNNLTVINKKEKYKSPPVGRSL